MPISEEFNGGGTKVMKNMKEEYGDAKGKSVFYATLQKRKNQGKMTGPRKPSMKRMAK